MTAKVNYSGVTGLWVDDLNSDQTNPYNLVDAVIRCDMYFGHFSLVCSAGVNNIFNTIYAGYTNVNSADKRFYIAGAPRNYSCTLNITYKF